MALVFQASCPAPTKVLVEVWRESCHYIIYMIFPFISWNVLMVRWHGPVRKTMNSSYQTLFCSTSNVSFRESHSHRSPSNSQILPIALKAARPSSGYRDHRGHQVLRSTHILLRIGGLGPRGGRWRCVRSGVKTGERQAGHIEAYH